MKFNFFVTDSPNFATVGHVVIYPDSYNASKKYPLFMFVHGIGERNNGTLGALKYLVDQYSWGSVIPQSAQQAVDLYDIIIVAPNYSSEFNPDLANYVFDSVIKNYSIDESKIGLTGFSLGGGAVLRYICSSQKNVDRLAIAVPVAPVAWYNKNDYIKNSSLPIWFHVNTNDTNSPTNLNVTLNELNEINSTNPPIAAIYTAYNKTGHGGQNEAWGLNPPKAPAGKGFTDASANIYEWLLMNTNTDHKAVPSGTSSSTTTSTSTKVDNSILAIAGADITTNNNLITLDGRASLGKYQAASWTLRVAPQGVNIYSPIIRGAGWITSTAVLPKEGMYIFELKVTSGSIISTDSLVVTYTSSGTTTSTTTKRLLILSKTEVPTIGKIIIIYDDGSIGYENLI